MIPLLLAACGTPKPPSNPSDTGAQPPTAPPILTTHTTSTTATDRCRDIGDWYLPDGTATERIDPIDGTVSTACLDLTVEEKCRYMSWTFVFGGTCPDLDAFLATFETGPVDPDGGRVRGADSRTCTDGAQDWTWLGLDPLVRWYPAPRTELWFDGSGQLVTAEFDYTALAPDIVPCCRGTAASRVLAGPLPPHPMTCTDNPYVESVIWETGLTTSPPPPPPAHTGLGHTGGDAIDSGR
jgi:hypothetical protein